MTLLTGSFCINKAGEGVHWQSPSHRTGLMDVALECTCSSLSQPFALLLPASAKARATGVQAKASVPHGSLRPQPSLTGGKGQAGSQGKPAFTQS